MTDNNTAEQLETTAVQDDGVAYEESPTQAAAEVESVPDFTYTGEDEPTPTIVNNQFVNLPDPDQDPVEVAAMLFTMYHPKYEQLVDKLTGKSARRLLKAIIGVPLVDRNFNHTNETERNTFAIAERLMEAKWIIIQASLYQHHQALQAATTAPTAEETAAHAESQSSAEPTAEEPVAQATTNEQTEGEQNG